MKRKHFDFLVLFLFGMFCLVMVYSFPNLVGSSIQESQINSFSSGEFKMSNLNVKITDDSKLIFDFNLKDSLGINRDLDVNYQLFNADGKVYFEEKKQIVLGAYSSGHYVFSSKIPQGEISGTLGVEVYDTKRDKREYSSYALYHAGITGDAIYSDSLGSGTKIFIFLLFIGILFGLFVIVRRIHSKRFAKNVAEEFHDNNLISLR